MESHPPTYANGTTYVDGTAHPQENNNIQPIQPPPEAYHNEKTATTVAQPQQPLQAQQQTYQQTTGQQQAMGMSVVPLMSLNKYPALVQCPRCQAQALTRVEAHSGNSTHGLAALLCICCCLGCIPYLISSLKDQEHFCGHCGTPLAVWHNSGHIEVIAR